jgi:geranylgeranyl diphosphate synthase type I
MTPKMGEVIVTDLKKRSKKGLEFAKQTLQVEKIEYPKLREALEHYIAHWDDFTHPGLFSVACEAVGGDPDDFVPTQAAIAMMAAAFDVHDDIIDKSKVKNKIPTVYGKFGVEMALLLGNAFLIEGFKLFVDSVVILPKEDRPLQTFKRLLFEVGNAHALEVGFKEKKNVVLSDFMKISEMKAAGIEADMYLGALFGRGEDVEVEVLARLGRILGILVFLREEIIDVFDIEELCQRISVKDLPPPLIFAMQDSGTKRKIMKIISKPKITTSDVAELVDVTLVSPSVVNLRDEMQLLIEEGLNLTSKLPKTKLRSQLQTMLSFMLEDLQP